MVAAEARASGIPLIVPDRGAAADQLVPGAGSMYRAGSQQALERALHAFIVQEREPQRKHAALHSEVRTIDEHFGQLFARYYRLRPDRRPEPSHAGSIKLRPDCHTNPLAGQDCATVPTI